MTLILIALWIVGNTFHWYWLVASVVLDVVWLSIKLNFLAVLVRRGIEEAQSSGEGPPPAA